MLLATVACHFSTSQLQKVVRTHSVFGHFDLQMSFSLQRRAIFGHLKFQKCAKTVLRATAACHFSCLLCSYLRTRRFSEPTSRPSRHTNPWKNAAFPDFPNISCRRIFFLLTFARLYLLSSDSTSLLCFSSSDSASLLCFFNCPYARKLDF